LAAEIRPIPWVHGEIAHHILPGTLHCLTQQQPAV
jgi:hypothetical protein